MDSFHSFSSVIDSNFSDEHSVTSVNNAKIKKEKIEFLFFYFSENQ